MTSPTSTSSSVIVSPLDDTAIVEGAEEASRGAKTNFQNPDASAVVLCFSEPQTPVTEPEPPQPQMGTGCCR